MTDVHDKPPAKVKAKAAKPSDQPFGAITIKDIAAELGLSHTTVSRALADHRHIAAKTKERVRAAATRQGYVASGPARLMRNSKSTLVGLIVPTARSEFWGGVANVIAEACTTEGFQLVLMISRDDPELERQQVQALCEARAAGAVIAPTPRMLPATLTLLRQLPAIQTIRTNPALDFDSVVIDDRHGMRIATEHLLSLGHRKIAYVGIPGDLSVGAARLEGVQDAIKLAGASTNGWSFDFAPPHGPSARVLIANVLRTRKPTALLLGGATFSLDALKAVRDLNLVLPRDLSLVTCGEHDWFSVAGPGLTTVDLPVDDTAMATASLLFRTLRTWHAEDGATRRSPTRIALRPELIVRGTTGEPSAS